MIIQISSILWIEVVVISSEVVVVRRFVDDCVGGKVVESPLICKGEVSTFLIR